MKKVAVLGSTGSIGTQTLNVIRSCSHELCACALAAYSNRHKLNEQALEFKPAFTALISKSGESCLLDAVKDCDIAVIATKGIAALDAVLYCINNGIDVAIANKEVLVCAGELVNAALKNSKARLIPVDSEHSAIYQCLIGRDKNSVSQLLLTASGGPFFEKSLDELKNVSAADALKHPTWSMGTKITIDSATMMNKSLEVIEASALFGVPSDRIQIVVHRQSKVHSMVRFCDGCIMAQIAEPNMTLPIEIALLGVGKDKLISDVGFDSLQTFTFQPCDFDKFPCARLGYDVWNYPALCRTVMNAANDVCVDAFIANKIRFVDFYPLISTTIDGLLTAVNELPLTVDSIKKVDKIAHDYAANLINGEACCL